MNILAKGQSFLCMLLCGGTTVLTAETGGRQVDGQGMSRSAREVPGVPGGDGAQHPQHVVQLLGPTPHPSTHCASPGGEV